MNILNPYRHAAAGGGVPVVEAFSVVSIPTSVTSITATDPGGITSGELLILLMVSDSSSAPYGTTPAGWTNLINYAGNSAAVGIFYKIASGSEGDVTVTVVHADHIAWYLRVSGVNTTTPFNVTASPATGIGSSRAIPEVTTTVDSCLAFYLLSFDGGDGYPFSVSGTGWTESDDHQSSTGGSVSSGCWGTKEQATAGLTGDATVSCSASDGQAYLQFAVAPA